MEWLIELGEAAFTLAGVWLTVHYTLKGKKLELINVKDENLVKCQEKHSERLEKVKNEFKIQLSEMNNKIDMIIKKQLEIDFRQKAIEEKLDDNRDLIEKMTSLEKVIAVLDNREKVSEHRLDDLEKHNEKKAND